MKQAKLRCGIIGAGNIAWKYDGGAFNGQVSATHSSCFDRHARTQLVAMFEPSSTARAALNEQHPNADRLEIYENVDDFLNQNLDFVSICSPSEYHVEHIAKCLDAKIPILWLEKPVTLELSDYKILKQKLDAVEKRPRIGVNFFRRNLPQFYELKKFVKTTKQLASIDIKYSRRLDVNGVHMIDILGFILDQNDIPDIDWVMGGPNNNPSFGFEINNVRVIFSGIDLPYHCIEISATSAEGRMSITRGGLNVMIEKKIENAQYPGFYHLSTSDNVGDHQYYQQAMNDGTYLNLCNLLDDQQILASDFNTAYFSQAILDKINRQVKL